MNMVANEQTEPEELKEDGGREGTTDGQAWGKVAFSVPSGLPKAQDLYLGPEAQLTDGGPLSPLPPQDSQETGQELRQSYFCKSSFSGQSSRGPGF